MTADEIIKEVGGVFSPWKVKNTLKKKSTGAKVVFTVNDGNLATPAARQLHCASPFPLNGRSDAGFHPFAGNRPNPG